MISKEAQRLEAALRLLHIRSVFNRVLLWRLASSHCMKPPRHFHGKYKITCTQIEGRPCYTLEDQRPASKHILYFPGGAYTIPPQKLHWRIIEHLLDNTPYQVTMVNYPLSPQSTCLETLHMARETCRRLCSESTELILAGDSSGGGLALALAQELAAGTDWTHPEKILLLSPWLDVSMADQIPPSLSAVDLILTEATLRRLGSAYAGPLDPQDPRCSPLYGELAGLGKIALFTGTSEILNLQAQALRVRLATQGNDFAYYEYQGMQHVWPGFSLPEAREALDQMVSFIKD